MRLKLLTAVFFLAVVVSMLAYPALLQAMPSRAAPREQRRAYAEKTLGYLGVMVFSLVGAGIGSFFVYRQARKEYEEESIRNLKALLDAQKKSAKAALEATDGDSDDAR